METLLALVLVSVLGQVQPFECPRSSTRGLYPNPEDCSKYYQCVDGGRYYPKNCPPGLWFDSRYSICNWPGYVSCYAQRPQIQPLASGEADPVLSGSIRRYPQQLGRQVHTTPKRTTRRTLPTNRVLRKRTTAYQPPRLTTLWTSRTPEVKTRTPRSPQTERPTTRQQPSTVNPTPEPITTPQSVLDWLYEDNLTYDTEEKQVENAHPEHPTKPTAINNVASMDEYGGFEDNQDYEVAGFDPPPECSAAFSLELDPTRCEGFYQCYLWIPYPKVCPAGLLFDHRSNVCNWPEYVYCLNGERYDPPETTTLEETATRAPVTLPPAPSNNFNPQGNGGFVEDNSYDDYWPIEDVMEDERHRTAFKNKGLQEESERVGSVVNQKAMTPEVKATTLMMHTDSMEKMAKECGPSGCDVDKVKTSDYKINPKMMPKASTKLPQKSTSPVKKESSIRTTTTVTATTNSPITIAANLSEIMSNESNSSSSESFESVSSVRDSESSSNESSSIGSSSALSSSSEEEKSSSESVSSEENNEIIKPQLTSNNVKIRENDIQVEIVEVKGFNDKTPPRQDSKHSIIKSNQISDSSPETEASEENTLNFTTADFDVNTTDSDEGSGSELVLSKIDILRNSVEQLLSDDNLSTIITTDGNSTNLETTVDTTPASVSNDTATNETDTTQTFTTTSPTTINTDNATYSNVTESSEMASDIPEKVNSSVAHSDPKNTTEQNTTSVFDDGLDLNATQTNVSDAAEGRVDKAMGTDQLNDSKTDSISLKNNTENTTLDTLMPDDNVTASNSSVSTEITEITVNTTTVNVDLNSTDHETTAASDNSTTETPLTTTTAASTSQNKQCSDKNCRTTKTPTPKAKSEPGIARASSKLVTKPGERRPDIVMLSGNSPIARILEKLLNIRMKQIGNNKYKAITATKPTTKETESPSENKIRSSPKSQHDEARTISTPKITSASATQETTPSANVTTDGNATSSAQPVRDTTTVSVTVSVTDVTAGVSESSANETATSKADLAAEELNVSMATSNATDNVSVITGPSVNSTEFNETDAESAGNLTSQMTTSTEKQTLGSSNATSTSAETSTVPVTSAETSTVPVTSAETGTVPVTSAEKFSAAVAEITPKETPSVEEKTSKVDTNTTGKTSVETTTADTTTQTVVSTSANGSIAETTMALTENSTETTNSSAEVPESSALNITTEVLLNTTTSTDETTNLTTTTTKTTTTTTQTESTTETNTPKKSASNKATAAISFSSNLTETNSSSETTQSVTEDNTTTTETLHTNGSEPLSSSTTEGSNATEPVTTTESNVTSNSTTTLSTPPGRTSRKQRETHKSIGKPTHFRQRGNAPHFEARKVFGGPDEKWRFSDGTLVDQFSRQQRDVDMSEASSANKLRPSLLAVCVIFFVYKHLA